MLLFIPQLFGLAAFSALEVSGIVDAAVPFYGIAAHLGVEFSENFITIIFFERVCLPWDLKTRFL